MNVTLKISGVDDVVTAPLVVYLCLGLEFDEVGGPAIHCPIVDVGAERELKVQFVTIYCRDLGLHPTRDLASLVCFDKHVYLIAYPELHSPFLAVSAQFLQLCIRDLIVIPVDRSFMVEKQCHRRVQRVAEPFALQLVGE